MLWEWLQGLGAVVGLLTGCFVLLERFTKHRPTVVIAALPFGGIKNAQRYLFARLRNTSDRPILIEVETGSAAGRLRLAQDNSVHAILTSLWPGSIRFALDAGEVAECPLLKPPDYAEMELEHECLLEVRWRFAQPILWRHWRKISPSVSKGALMVLLDEEQDDEE